MQYTKIPVDPKTQQILEDAHEAVKLKLGLSRANLSAEDVFNCLVMGREHIREGAIDLVKAILPYLTEDQLVELLIPLLTRPRPLQHTIKSIEGRNKGDTRDGKVFVSKKVRKTIKKLEEQKKT